MDLRCERCATEYELDDSRISETGTAVQCGSCGYTFQVRRPSGAVAQQPQAGHLWVRTADGNVHSVSGLPWLQKWILERRVSAHDQVSTDGQTWRRLSELSELEAAFRMVDQSAAPPASPVKRPSTLEDLAVEVDASRGSLPQAVSQQETDLVTLARRRRGTLKLAVALAVTAVVSYAGISFQEGRGRRLRATRTTAPSAVSAASSQVNARPLVQPLPAPPAVAPPAPEPEPAEAPVAATPAPAKTRSTPARVVEPVVGESYEALVAQAERLLQKRSGVKAQQHFEQALKLRPSGPEALNGLGQLALNRGQLGPAASYFKRAIADRPFPPALFGLGEVYRGSSNRDLALQFYKRYLQVAPNGSHAALARRRISSIDGH